MNIDQILDFVPEAQRAEAKAALDTHGTVTAEKVIEYVKTDEGRKAVQPVIDSAVSKAVDAHDKKFMTDKFPGLLNDEIKKRHPDQTPEQKELAELRVKIDEAEHMRARSEQVAITQKRLASMGLPINIAEKYAGVSEEETTANIGQLKSLIEWRDDAVKKKDDEWMSKGVKPKSGDSGNGKTMLRANFNLLPPAEKENIIKAGVELTD